MNPDDTAVNGDDNDDTEVVFGWMSTSTPTLARRRSRSSVKSNGSRKSSISRRLFGSHRSGPKDHSDGEEVESDDANSHHKRNGAANGPTSPLPHHVSFQFTEPPPIPSSTVPPTVFLSDGPAHLDYHLSNPPFLGTRKRSASRGSILSLASTSSGSTIRQLPHRANLQAERKLREMRHENLRTHLVRSRISLSLPHPEGPKPHTPAARYARAVQEGEHPRRMATSSPLAAAGSADGSSELRRPFYVSPEHAKSMEPSFTFDAASLSASSRLPATLQRIERISIGVWVVQEDIGSHHTSNAFAKNESRWDLLLEYDLNFRGLISLGNDVSLSSFPASDVEPETDLDATPPYQPLLFPENLPPNTLILRFSGSNDYWTTRLPPLLLRERLEEIDEDGVYDADEPDGVANDGNMSDPGPASSARRARRSSISSSRLLARERRERDLAVARRKAILERSLRETKMHKSLDDDGLAQFVQLELEMAEAAKGQADLQKTLEDLISDPEEILPRRAGEREYFVESYRRDFDKVREEVEQSQRIRRMRAEGLRHRKDRLAKAREALTQQQTSLAASKTEHELDKEVCSSIKLHYAQRRTHLVAELSTIFPIEPVNTGDLLFSICGIELPNISSDSKLQTPRRPFDDDLVSSALGYAAQVVQLLAAYLAVSLHYPVRCMGSRSLVQDPISQIKGPKIFPLYTKGVDRYRFDYAVFLLNKDIEQLMLEHGIVVLDLRQTLPNLKNLFLTLSTDATTQ